MEQDEMNFWDLINVKIHLDKIPPAFIQEFIRRNGNVGKAIYVDVIPRKQRDEFGNDYSLLLKPLIGTPTTGLPKIYIGTGKSKRVYRNSNRSYDDNQYSQAKSIEEEQDERMPF